MVFYEHKSEWPTMHKNYMMAFDAGGFMELYWYKENPKFCIQNLHVLPHARKNGVGNKLLEAAEANARGNGFDELYLFVDKDSWQKEWYERKGFEYHDDFEDDENVIWMVKSVK